MTVGAVAMPLFLAEHEVGFDPRIIGFPSIQGCMAIVLVCETGVFGYHNPPTNPIANESRAKYFAEFYNQHNQCSPITRMYGITHRAVRGYGPGEEKRGVRRELKMFARQLGYSGKIRSCNLDPHTIANARGGRSAYVEVRKAATKGEIHFRQWEEGLGTKAANTQGYNLRRIHHTQGIQNQTMRVFTGMDRNQLQRLHSKRV